MADKEKTNNLFPRIQRDISNFLMDQEGNIPRNKILAVGSMMILLSVVLAQDAFAKHTSHSSHKSHSSHSSHSSGSGGSHSSHESHVSHQSHASHSSGEHSSHSSFNPSTTPNPVVPDSPNPVPSSSPLPSVMEIEPPQIPQPNQVPNILPNLSSATLVVQDSGATPEFTDQV